MPPLTFVVDRREAGQTLAAVLKARYGLSWSQAKRLVEGKHVRVSGQVESDVARRLKGGKRVEIAAGTIERKEGVGKKQSGLRRPDAAITKSAPPSRGKAQKRAEPTLATRSGTTRRSADIAIVYSDDAIVVVNKPAGLTTMRHQEEAAEFGERAKAFLPKTLSDLLPVLLGAPTRPVLAVHRIDRDTTGLVVFARTRKAAENLTKQFRKHSAERRYLALTRGTPPGGRIESVLVRDRGDGRRGSTRKTNPPDGKRAVTHVKVLESFDGFALVECRLETGRTHQVRIHLGEASTPLCGEMVYDRPINGKPLPDVSGSSRPMLHAARLGFVHPETGESMDWEVPQPDDFQSALERVKAMATRSARRD